eukprot:1143092-Pelagomonas_calceolata.AAC.4
MTAAKDMLSLSTGFLTQVLPLKDLISGTSWIPKMTTPNPLSQTLTGVASCRANNSIKHIDTTPEPTSAQPSASPSLLIAIHIFFKWKRKYHASRIPSSLCRPSRSPPGCVWRARGNTVSSRVCLPASSTPSQAV